MVNVKDINQFEQSETLKDKDFIKQIFDKQKELIDKYKHIENIPDKINIDSAEHQKLLKEFTFRGIEELAESYEAYLHNNKEHMTEELSDAIHFFTEVLILAEIGPEDIVSIDSFEGKKLNIKEIKNDFWNITYKFAISCNKLKCKPWKQTQVLTDKEQYRRLLIEAYDYFMLILGEIGFSGKEILEIYNNKHLVNKFRIRSKY